MSYETRFSEARKNASVAWQPEALIHTHDLNDSRLQLEAQQRATADGRRDPGGREDLCAGQEP